MKIDRLTLCSATLGQPGKIEPPLGPLYIASACRTVGIDVDFRDYQLCAAADAFHPDTLSSFLLGHAPILAVSCFVDMLPAVIAATRRIFANNPSTLIVLGGPGPAASAARIVEQYPWIHAVFRGEGEGTIREWLKQVRLDKPGPVPGMVRRGQRTIWDGGARPRIQHLDALSDPAYDLIDWKQYTHARVITARGCPYRCSFCDVTSYWNHRCVFRNLNRVLDEIALLRERYGVSRLAVVDDTFVLKPGRVRRFCQLLQERGARVRWGCFGRIDLMTPEIMELMAAAGCEAVFYGIDSGSQSVLNRIRKNLDVKLVMPCLKRSAEVFRKVEASFIWGYPFETVQDFRRTVALAAEASILAPIVNVQFHMLSPLPFSDLYREHFSSLQEPEDGDREWLLLPALLLQENGRELLQQVRANPEVYPGFFTYATPCKHRKRGILKSVLRSLDRTIGLTLFNRDVASLLDRENSTLEQRLLADARYATRRIGVGLALGLFRRSRARTEGVCHPASDSTVRLEAVGENPL